MVQSQSPTATTPLASVMDWTKAALPQGAFYGTHELIVPQNEHLYILITGGTNAVQYTASVAVENFKEFVRGRL